jgi:enamine deaminase RidA (YjgF/YER057c/UK114 family)
MTDASSAQLPVTADFINPKTLHHPAGYTQAVEVTAGRPAYTAGQVALDPTGALVGPGDIGAQARQVFGNLKAALQAVGPGFDQYVNVEQPPASTAMEVRRRVRDDLHIEVEAIAVVASVQPMTATA